MVVGLSGASGESLVGVDASCESRESRCFANHQVILIFFGSLLLATTFLLADFLGQENEEVEKRPYENVEIPITCTRGRDPLKVKNKVPIPTPRNITPSREQNSISSGSQGQSFDSIPINIDDSPKHDKIKTFDISPA